MQSDSGLRNLLTRLTAGSISVDDAVQAIAPESVQVSPDESATSFVDLDLDRRSRCGFPEVIFGQGKTVAQITAIIEAQSAAGQSSLVTRLESGFGESLIKRFPVAIFHPEAHTLRKQVETAEEGPEHKVGSVAVIAAGTSDLPVAEEAIETLRWMRVPVERIVDVGVAGPHRLAKHVEFLGSCSAIVVVAGLEGALPSVVGGWVSCPVIGVPTSIGYGVSLGGMTPLFAMLSSCASNVVTVNIDGGFRGGYAAGLIAHGASQRVSQTGGAGPNDLDSRTR